MANKPTKAEYEGFKKAVANPMTPAPIKQKLQTIIDQYSSEYEGGSEAPKAEPKSRAGRKPSTTKKYKPLPTPKMVAMVTATTQAFAEMKAQLKKFGYDPEKVDALSDNEAFAILEEVKGTMTTRKPSTPRATKKTATDIEKAKAQIKAKTGKTEEECEAIIEQYRALRSKAQEGKRKAEQATATNRKRVAKLEDKGDLIEGTNVKTADAVIETTAQEVAEKIEQEIEAVEAKAETEAKAEVAKDNTKKTPKQKKEAVEAKVEKKVKERTKIIVKKVVIDTSALLTSISNSLGKFDKDSQKEFLIKLRSDIDTLISKYAFGGMTDGATQVMNVQQSNLSASSVNPTMFANGGGVDSGAKIRIDSVYIDVYEDSYEEGEGRKVNSYPRNELVGKLIEPSKLLNFLSDELYTTNEPSDYSIMDGAIFTSQLVDEDSNTATEREKTEWKKGNLTLYSENIRIGVSIIHPTETTDEELSKLTGIGLYKKGGKVKLSSKFAQGGGVGSMNRYDAVVYFVTNDGEEMEKEYLGINASSKDGAESIARVMFFRQDAVRYDAYDINYVSVWDRGTAYENGGSVKTNSKEVKQKIRQHILDSVYDYNENEFDNFNDASQHLSDEFKRVADYPNNIRRYPNNQKRFRDYLQGIPFNFYFYDADIEDFLNGLGINPKGKKYTSDQMWDLYSLLIWREIEPTYKSNKFEDGGVVGQEIVFDYQGEEKTGVIKDVHNSGDYIVSTDDGRTLLAQRDRDVISLGKMREKSPMMEAKKKRFGFFGKGGRVFGEDARLEYVDDAFASDELKDELREKLGIETNSLGDNVVISFAYTDYGGDFLDKVAIRYFEENYPENTLVENAGYGGQNAYVFGEPAQEWIDTTDDYPLGFENIEDLYYEMQNEAEYESYEYFLDDLERDDYVFDKDAVLFWLMENKGGYYSMTTQGLDFSYSDLTDELVDEGLISKEDEDEDEYARGGSISVYNLRKGDKIKTRKGEIETIERKIESGYFTKESDYSHPFESIEFIERPKYARGGKLWIDTKTKGGLKGVKPSRKNSFARQAQKRGITSGQLASKVLANPSRYQGINPKSAQLVKNMGVRKHGGSIGDILRNRRGQ